MTTIEGVKEWIENEIATAHWREIGAMSRMDAIFRQGYAFALRKVSSLLDDLE